MTSAVFPMTLAVTFAAREVVSVVLAIRVPSVMADELESAPASVLNVTGIPARPNPDTSSTRAVIVDVPLRAERLRTRADEHAFGSGAADLQILQLARGSPENAVIVAVPLWPAEMNFTRTWPLFVRASLGSMRPIVVVNETSVPFCTGVPAPAVVVVVVPVPSVVPVPGV